MAAELAGIADAAERRTARMTYRERMADYRHESRQLAGFAKLADALAKFGGGSLLTTTLLLMINGKAPLSVVITAVFALLIFLVSTIIWVVLELGIAERDSAAERLDAVLKETER